MEVADEITGPFGGRGAGLHFYCALRSNRLRRRRRYRGSAMTAEPASAQPPPVVPPPSFSPRSITPAAPFAAAHNGTRRIKQQWRRRQWKPKWQHAARTLPLRFPSCACFPLRPFRRLPPRQLPADGVDAAYDFRAARRAFRKLAGCVANRNQTAGFDRSAQVALPVHLIEPVLKRGRVIFSWRHICVLGFNPRLSAVSIHDGIELELPLKILAPLFVAAQKAAAKPQQKLSVTGGNPEFVFRFSRKRSRKRSFRPTPLARATKPAAIPQIPGHQFLRLGRKRRSAAN